ncbi:major capsid protein [Peromfec virus RodF8_20]|uniref:Major capsid protein n=1 Tax=Peromfec virus RodF8_20 TaxID=2929362 RepID=A0A976N2W0_9VIRU|nr:major capsid protein [Peromfec virus RodF8_20]
MASTPVISHTINGYSRYDQPFNVGFTATAGIAYPVFCDFLNAGDVITTQVGAVVRASPQVVPSFTPYRVRLHRFFCPMQLYHPEMRVNSAGFDMENLTFNALPVVTFGPVNKNIHAQDQYFKEPYAANVMPRSLLAFLRLAYGHQYYGPGDYYDWTGKSRTPALTPGHIGYGWVNADPVLAYYDIIRMYYSFSQTDQFSLAYSSGNQLWGNSEPFSPYYPNTSATAENPAMPIDSLSLVKSSDQAWWGARIATLSDLDDYYETSNYPRSTDVTSYIDRSDLVLALINASRRSAGTKFTMEQLINTYSLVNMLDYNERRSISVLSSWIHNLPLGLIPASADRYSRTIPEAATRQVSLSGVNTVSQLAIAARSQEYADLLSAGDNRFSGWLYTFFGRKINHIDRPLLLYSSSFYLNSTPIFNQQGSPGQGLGDYGGTLSGQAPFGKRPQRYMFDEPGYLMDIVSIQPLYYWSGVQADYAGYDKMDYFNPIFNEIGFQSIPVHRFYQNIVGNQELVVAKEPCYNEFRSSYDYVLGDFMSIGNYHTETEVNDQILTKWVMQRTADSVTVNQSQIIRWLSLCKFVDISSVNAPFSSDAMDNFYINLYYSYIRKSLVSKNFATKLATR